MKKLILIALMAALCLSVKAQTQIKGVVTYYFNEYQGDKPDIGAKVMIYKIDSAQLNKSFIDDYLMAKTFKYAVDNTKKKNRVGDYFTMLSYLKELHAVTKSGFDSLDRKTTQKLLNVEYDKKTINLIVDGNGNYSTNVEPGFYEVIIKSNGRTSSGETEVTGKIYCKDFKVTKDNPYILNKRFDQY